MSRQGTEEQTKRWSAMRNVTFIEEGSHNKVDMISFIHYVRDCYFLTARK